MKPLAYYNEFEAYAADWLHNLIAEGLIPAGDVDTRSIEDVQPDDLRGYTQCHFFAGIGGWSLALRLAGWPDERPVWTGSCPCQPFSAAGKGKGTADERHLWPAFYWLIRQRAPGVVFGEQVASKAGRLWFAGVQADLEALGYSAAAADLCAAGVGAPQPRQRLWWVADAGRAVHERLCRSGEASGAARAAEGEARELERGGSAAGAGGASGGGLAESDEQCVEQERADASRCGEGSEAQGLVERSGRVRSRGGLGDAVRERRAGDSLGLVGAGVTPDRQVQEEAGSVGVVCSRLADDDGAGRGWQSASNGTKGPLEVESGHHAHRRGRAFDPWGRAIWIPCADGKARRIEPGIEPLAHGVPARVGKLRAWGNAIVPQVAAEVIGSYMDSEWLL